MTAPATTESLQAELERKLADPAFRLAMEIFVGELFQQLATYHQAQVQTIVDWATERQLNRVKTGITKRYLFDRLTEIRKSPGGINHRREDRPDVWNETLWERSPDGKFAGYNGVHADKLVNRNWKNETSRVKGLYYEGDPEPKMVIEDAQRFASPEERASHHSALGRLIEPTPLPAGVTQAQHGSDVHALFADLTYQLMDKTGNPEDKQRVQFVIQSPDGAVRVITPPAGTMPRLSLETGERVQFMTPVGPEKLVTTAGKAVNIGYLAGMSPDDAAKAGAVTGDVQRALSSTDWGQKMEASASALKVLSNNKQQVAQAHAVIQLLNLFGPQFSQAFQHRLTALGYRYMGQSAPKEYWGPAASEGRQIDSKGTPESMRNYELKLARDLVPSIPTEAQYKLALQAGSTPPSRGYLLNKRGQVVNESVGYADDWYTPFDLRQLPKARGGSYVRTRGFGGITPEDIRLAMRAGVNRVTVVSNNGVFTMEFDPQTMHYGHRYGYAGHTMTRRYQRALESIKGNKVKVGDGASGSMKLDATGYASAMRDLQSRNPYFIKSESVSQPFHEPPRAFGHVYNATTGEGAYDTGTLLAGGLHADDARNWHGEAARKTFTDPRTGRYANNDVSRAAAMDARLNGVSSVLYQRPDGLRHTAPGEASYNDERANAGLVSTGRGYTPDQAEKHWDGPDARASAEDVEALMHMYRANGIVPKNVDGFDALGEVNRTLFPANRRPRNQRDYENLVEKLRTSEAFRTQLADDLHEVLNGRTLRGHVSVVPGEVFATLRGEDPEQEAEKAEFNTPEHDEYADAVHSDGHAPVLRHELKQSEAVQSWFQDQQALRQSADTPEQRRKANEQLSEYREYRDAIDKIERARQNNRGRLPRVEQVLTTPRERAVYNAWNPKMARMIVHGYQASRDEGLDPEVAQSYVSNFDSASVHRKSKRIASADIDDRGMNPADVANDHLVALQEEGLSGDELGVTLADLAQRYEEFANKRARRERQEGKTANFHHSGDYSDVAAKLREYYGGDRS